MSKEEIIAFLVQKKNLTSAVQNARADVASAQKDLNRVKKRFRTMLIVSLLIALVTFTSGEMFLIWVIFVGVVCYFRFRDGKRINTTLREATRNLANEEQQPDYQKGMQDFPQKFYSYWTIDRLIHLVQENRATTLQEAFNVAETQDFQHDQLAIQQENLAVSKSTNSAAKTSAIANVFTAMNTRR
ncbi:hypothetical protein [Furfurilactobacillus curtus]|uniref:Uncharacterized protein n=1 Tax=Furfurilactobacillus curtus TaxID=1746200 RepID=A0ABQ5JPY9_9LACO